MCNTYISWRNPYRARCNNQSRVWREYRYSFVIRHTQTKYMISSTDWKLQRKALNVILWRACTMHLPSATLLSYKLKLSSFSFVGFLFSPEESTNVDMFMHWRWLSVDRHVYTIICRLKILNRLTAHTRTSNRVL